MCRTVPGSSQVQAQKFFTSRGLILNTYPLEAFMDERDFATRHFALMAKVAATVGAMPAEILEHHYHPESFGSWLLKFRHKARIMRLVYDGKEAWLSLERASVEDPRGWAVLSSGSIGRQETEIELRVNELLTRIRGTV
jgi:hypothetical protein